MDDQSILGFFLGFFLGNHLRKCSRLASWPASKIDPDKIQNARRKPGYGSPVVPVSTQNPLEFSTGQNNTGLFSSARPIPEAAFSITAMHCALLRLVLNKLSARAHRKRAHNAGPHP